MQHQAIVRNQEGDMMNYKKVATASQLRREN